MLSVNAWKKALRTSVCPFCATDELSDVDVNELGDAAVTCADGHRWELSAPAAVEHSAGRIGVLEGLHVYETLSDLFTDPDASYREHGIIEHLFSEADPTAYRQLITDYGHTSYAPQRHTASAMIGRALGQLAREGQLIHQRHRGTGYWSYNSDVGYWALHPGPSEEDRLTWATWAAERGINARDWPATGFVHTEPYPR
jgi:hypothetical protein